ncbi:arylsulfatase B [Caerostris extrusa]|uniref:Arylsulfatase B n=1 Tax=Caerostris extrusa TaxID=172846 RepID=A0AAV4MW18_CAEEX|nr:arylsulfatase B [Caerostris extrusa]
MVEKTDPEENERTSYPVWPRILAMFASFALVAIVFTAVALLNAPTVSPKPELPHIIFILADDLGWNDVSLHGSPQIPTPNIDALAASGVVLNNYYTHPQCTPSRGALMSGKYANRVGLHHGDLRPAEASGLPLNVAILPEYMKKRGYKSHMIGKKNDSLTGDAGNENSIVSPDSEAKISGNVKTLFGIDLWENEEVIRDFRGEYATNVFTDKALDVIEKHNITKPLFLFVSHAASQTGNKVFHYNRHQNCMKENHIKETDRRIYAGMVESLDDSVGKIFEALSQKDMLQKTIIVISSDNGGAAEPGSSSNWPQRD